MLYSPGYGAREESWPAPLEQIVHLGTGAVREPIAHAGAKGVATHSFGFQYAVATVHVGGEGTEGILGFDLRKPFDGGRGRVDADIHEASVWVMQRLAVEISKSRFFRGEADNSHLVRVPARNFVKSTQAEK